MLKDRKRSYTSPLKITEEGKRQIQSREFVQNVYARVSALVAMKVIHALDRNHVFQMMIGLAASGNGLDYLPLFGESSQLERFVDKHQAELQDLTPELTMSEFREGYQRLLADSFQIDISAAPTYPNNDWNGWVN